MKMDGGSTSNLLQTIALSANPTALYDTLKIMAPYLSDSALRAAANNKLTKPDMLDLMKKCPDQISETMLDYLANSSPLGFTVEDMDTLRAYRLDYSALTADNNAISAAWSTMCRTHGDIISFIQTDTTGIAIDTLGYWYQQLPALWAHYAACLMYLGNKDYALSSAVYDAIPGRFTMNEAAQAEYNNYSSLINLLKAAFQANRTELQLDSGELSSLLAIANDTANNATFLAREIYNQNKSLLDIACHTNEGNNTARRLGPNAGNSWGNPTKITQAKWVKVYPNPANNWVNFEYHFTKPMGNVLLTIRSMSGQEFYRVALSGTSGLQVWNTQAIAAGTYRYKIANQERVMQTGMQSVVH
ncbi:MAG: T9SS type A sorting domain-containing protein [Bacteroidetes bacterium]|nr:T9SS type A sorting domain-containing protein [Bacteroidota bacterium]